MSKAIFFDCPKSGSSALPTMRDSLKLNTMKRSLFLLILPFSLNSNAQTTGIPDANFEQALINLGYDDVIDGNVLTSSIADVKELLIGGYNISDLSGIQDFKSLKKLYCNSNNLSRLDVSQNELLVSLHCQYNQLTHLDVSNNKLLVDLNCSHNLMKTVDVGENNGLNQASFNTIEAKPEKRKRVKRNPTLFDNTFFVDGMVGLSSATINEVVGEHSYYVYHPEYSYTHWLSTYTVPAWTEYRTDNVYGDVQRSFVNLDLKLGNKWYWGSRKNWRLGLKATWLKLGAQIPTNGIRTQVSAALANIGFANMFKLSEERGIEFNATFGYNLSLNSNRQHSRLRLASGMATDVEVKFRLKQFAIGLDYSTQLNNGYPINGISVCVGGNF